MTEYIVTKRVHIFFLHLEFQIQVHNFNIQYFLTGVLLLILSVGPVVCNLSPIIQINYYMNYLNTAFSV